MAERFNCTAATPWPGNTACHVLIVHNDAHEVGEQEDGRPGGEIGVVAVIREASR